MFIVFKTKVHYWEWQNLRFVYERASRIWRLLSQANGRAKFSRRGGRKGGTLGGLVHRSCDGTLRNKVRGKFHVDTVRYYCCSNRIEKSLERISQVVIGFFCKLFSLFSLLLSLYDLQPKDWRMTRTRLYAASSFQRQYKIGKINISINFEFTLSALFFAANSRVEYRLRFRQRWAECNLLLCFSNITHPYAMSPFLIILLPFCSLAKLFSFFSSKFKAKVRQTAYRLSNIACHFPCWTRSSLVSIRQTDVTSSGLRWTSSVYAGLHLIPSAKLTLTH